MSLVSDHLERVRAATTTGFTLATVPRWIEKNTRLEGEPFSFRDHEYQLRILQDQSREIVVRKCSQTGLTELAIRRTFAIMDILPDIHVIYTLPTSNFAKMVVKTRFDPVIVGSPYLRERVSSTIDSMDTKQIGSSFLYVKGTIGQASAISVPASLLVHDEVDFSDQSVLSSYQSRLTHSRYKMRFDLSTPTVPNFGIDAKFRRSRRHFNLAKCSHCNHWFKPDYFEHVHVPGFDQDLRHITGENLHAIRYQEAHLLCPHCGKEPDLGPDHREWVVENPDEAHVAAGYQVSPFDAPAIITPAFLVEAGTKYKRYADFINFNLGQPIEDKDNSVSRSELEALFLPGEAPRFGSYVYGIDAGLTMHLKIAGVLIDGSTQVVHVERVPLGGFMARLSELLATFPCVSGVMDSQPYADLVLRVQEVCPRIFGAVYVRSNTTETFSLLDREENREAKKTELRLVRINRNKAFDYLMRAMREGKFTLIGQTCALEKEVWVNHLTDMRRIQKFDADDELYFNWEKSEKGVDHYHHTALYCHIAAQMRGFVAAGATYGTLVTKFKNKTL